MAALRNYSKYVAEMTDNKFQIQVFAAGEIVPGLQALDATSNGTIEMSHTVSYYYVGKDPTFAIYSAVPFGLNARMQNSWWYQGGGMELGNEFFKKFGVDRLSLRQHRHPDGWLVPQGDQDGRRSYGLKFRIGGIAGQVLQKVGVVPQQLAGGDIYPALEKGTIDAAEWVGPYDDEKLGFQKVAKYYYYPGFWEGGPMVHAFCNLEKWNSLPKNYQAIVAQRGRECQQLDGGALRHGKSGGIETPGRGRHAASPFTNEVLEACLKATNELWGEISARNADFKKSIDAMQAYRSDQYLWWQVAEYTFDSFMIRSARG